MKVEGVDNRQEQPGDIRVKACPSGSMCSMDRSQK